MSKKLRNSILLGSVAFVLFYGMSLWAMLLPYAPSVGAKRIMTYGTFLFFFLPACTGWILLLRKSRDDHSSVPQRRLTQAAKSLSAIFVFSALMAFSMQRWLAVPTKLFADSPIHETLSCDSISPWGKKMRGVDMIQAETIAGKEPMFFPWPREKLPKCPGRIEIVGRQWLWGVFIEEVK